MPSNLFPSIAHTPEPPYYAVIFTSVLRCADDATYQAEASLLLELVQQQPGFLGMESYRDPDGAGVTICYWQTMEHIQGWRSNARHQEAQRAGQEKWYQCYSVRICRVEQERSWFASDDQAGDR